MRTIRDDIERDRRLSKCQRPSRIYKPSGLRCVEVESGSEIIYCSACKGPVVNSPRAKEKHGQNSMECRKVMGLD